MSNRSLGPEVRPGEVVLRAENVGRDTITSSTVLAVVQNGARRIVFVCLAPHFRPGGVPHLGRMFWSSRLAGRGEIWGVSHTRVWEGPSTLDEAIADMQELFGPLEVLRATDVEAIAAAEIRRTDEAVPGPVPPEASSADPTPAPVSPGPASARPRTAAPRASARPRRARPPR